MRDTVDELGQLIYDKYYLWQRVGAAVTNVTVIGISYALFGFDLSFSSAGITPSLVAWATAVSAVRYLSSRGKHGVSERFNTFVMEDQADAGQKATHYIPSGALNYAQWSGFLGGMLTATLSPYYIASNLLFIPGLSKYPVLPRPYL